MQLVALQGFPLVVHVDVEKCRPTGQTRPSMKKRLAEMRQCSLYGIHSQQIQPPDAPVALVSQAPYAVARQRARLLAAVPPVEARRERWPRRPGKSWLQAVLRHCDPERMHACHAGPRPAMVRKKEGMAPRLPRESLGAMTQAAHQRPCSPAGSSPMRADSMVDHVAHQQSQDDENHERRCSTPGEGLQQDAEAHRVKSVHSLPHCREVVRRAAREQTECHFGGASRQRAWEGHPSNG